MLCNMYSERAGTRQSSDLREASIANDQNETQNMLNSAAETQEPLSPISNMTTVSIADTDPQPVIRNESTARKALRFMNLPLTVSPIRLRAERPNQSQTNYYPATAPSPTPIYRDMPGTPRKLF